MVDPLSEKPLLDRLRTYAAVCTDEDLARPLREAADEIERLTQAIQTAIREMTDEGLEGSCLWKLRAAVSATDL